jgi:hypothetical protein
MSNGTVFVRLLLAAALAAAASCGSSSSSSTAPTAAATTTDEFSGSLTQNGSVSHVFAVAANGSVSITLTAVSPLTTMSLGVGVTTSDGTNCLTTITQTADARAGSVALTGTATSGNYCARIYDSGNIPAGTDVSYTVHVVHP